MDCRPIIEKLRKEQDAQMEELRYLLEHLDEESSASRIASEIASHILSGCPSVTDSEVNNLFSIVAPFKL